MQASKLAKYAANKCLEQFNERVSAEEMEVVLHTLQQEICCALIDKKRIELRGFGSFSNHLHPERLVRNLRTGSYIRKMATFWPHFKPGKSLRNRVNQCPTTKE